MGMVVAHFPMVRVIMIMRTVIRGMFMPMILSPPFVGMCVDVFVSVLMVMGVLVSMTVLSAVVIVQVLMGMLVFVFVLVPVFMIAFHSFAPLFLILWR
jgi:hypothetical protein